MKKKIRIKWLRDILILCFSVGLLISYFNKSIFSASFFIFFFLHVRLISDTIDSLFNRNINSKSPFIPRFHSSFTRFVLHFISKKPWEFFFILVANIITISQGMVFGGIFGRIIQQLSLSINNRESVMDWSNCGKLIALYYGYSLFVATISALGGLVTAKVMPWFAKEVREYYFKYVLSHSYFHLSKVSPGDLISKITYIVNSSSKVIDTMLTLMIPVGFLSVFSIILFYTGDPSFVLIFIIWVIIHVIVVMFRMGSYVDAAIENTILYNRLMGIFSDIFRNIFVIKLAHSNAFEKKYFEKYNNMDISSYEKLKMHDKITGGILEYVYYTAFALIFIYYLVKKYSMGIINISQVVEINQTLRTVASKVWDAAQKIGEILMEVSRCNESLKELCVPHLNYGDSKEHKLKNGGHLNGSVVFENIYFCYDKTLDQLDIIDRKDQDGKSYLFVDFSVEIKPNSRVALVGLSGSGKSTFIHLLLRLFDPIKGSIIVNGQDTSKVTKLSLRNKFAFIPQGQFIFYRSLFENIAYGASDLRRKLVKGMDRDLKFKDLDNDFRNRIIEAAKKSGAHDFIMNLQDGYDSVYGTDIGLSGGQCQRIMIARAFTNDKAKFLILDEATSALDPKTEKSIKQSIDELSKNKTTIVIAHRLHTIKDFDRIIVFDKGQIVEDGTHDELINNDKLYSKMWSVQENNE